MLGTNSLGLAYPTVVVEVATTQRLGDCIQGSQIGSLLEPQSSLYLLVIKIWGFYQDSTLAIVALLYERARANPFAPAIAISLRTANIERQSSTGTILCVLQIRLLA